MILKLKMKATNFSGFLPILTVLLALYATVTTAWPQGHHRHGLAHRDRKGHSGNKGDDSSVSVAIVTASSMSTVSLVAFGPVPTNVSMVMSPGTSLYLSASL